MRRNCVPQHITPVFMFCGINPSECATSRLAVYVPLPTFAFAMTPFLISPVTPHQRHGRHTACAPQDTAVSLCPRTASPSDAPPTAQVSPCRCACSPCVAPPWHIRVCRHGPMRPAFAATVTCGEANRFPAGPCPPRKVRFLFIGGTTRHTLNEDVTRKDTMQIRLRLGIRK